MAEQPTDRKVPWYVYLVMLAVVVLFGFFGSYFSLIPAAIVKALRSFFGG